MMSLCAIFFLCTIHPSLALEIPDVTPPGDQQTARDGGTAGQQAQTNSHYLQVNFEILRLRERPTTAAPVIVVLKYGEALELLERIDSRWLRVKTRSGLIGFIAGEYTRAIPRTEAPMHIPILFFHHIGEPAIHDPYANLHFPISKLEELTQFLVTEKYHTAHTADLAQIPSSDRVVILNFDDGYDNTYTAAYPILKKYGLTATVYVISGFIGTPGYLTEAQIQELAKAGWEIGSHTITHPDLAHITTEQVKIELTESKKTLAKITGQEVTTLCYPAGKYDTAVIKIAKEVGYVFARTTEPGIVTNLKKPYELPARRVLPSMGLETWKRWF